MIDMFDTRVMLAALEQMPSANTFLRDTFFRNTINFDTRKVDVDVVKGKRRVAVYVKPSAEGHVSDRAGYSTNTYEAPYIKEKRPTTAGDIFKRAAGDNIYSPRSPQDRANIQLNKDLSELDQMITRSEEIQCSQALFAGAVTVLDESGKTLETIDFGVAATHKLASNAGHTLWSGASLKKTALLKQLRDWRALIIKDSGIAPTDLVMGSSAVDAFLGILDPDDATAGNSLSSIRVDRGQIDPRLLPNGVTYWGYLKELGCDVWSYDEYYHNGSTDVAIVPVKQIWMGSRNARFDRLYGAIQEVDNFYAVPRFAKSWKTDDPSVRWVMLQSAPLMVPHQVDSFLTAAVLS